MADQLTPPTSPSEAGSPPDFHVEDPQTGLGGGFGSTEGTRRPEYIPVDDRGMVIRQDTNGADTSPVPAPGTTRELQPDGPGDTPKDKDPVSLIRKTLEDVSGRISETEAKH